MSQKEFNLDVDDMCYYLESDNEYVKSCEKEFYCNKRSFSNTIGICQKTSDIIKKLGDDCTFSSQCDSGLECININVSFKIVQKHTLKPILCLGKNTFIVLII